MVNVILLVTDKEFELREKSTFARGKSLPQAEFLEEFANKWTRVFVVHRVINKIFVKYVFKHTFSLIQTIN